MKTLFKILLLLIPLLSQAKDINLAAGGDIGKATSTAVSGDVVRLASGNFTLSGTSIDLKPGVSIVGSGKDKTIIKITNNMTWWYGTIKLSSDVVTAGNQEISNLTLQGDNSVFGAIQVLNRTNIKLYNLNATGFFDHAIQVIGSKGKGSSNIEIYNFNFKDCSRESTGGSYGTIQLAGYNSNIYIHDGYIEHINNGDAGQGFKKGGYAIKGLPTYSGSTNDGGLMSGVKYYLVTANGKVLAAYGGNQPNISFEWYGIGVQPSGDKYGVEVDSCTTNAQLSIEYSKNADVAKTFWVHRCKITPGYGQAFELAVPNSLVEYNEIFFQNNQNGWNVFGLYNGDNNVGGIEFRYNKIYLGSQSPNLYCAKGQVIGINIHDNIWQGTGTPTLVWFRGGSSGSSVIWKNNTLPANYTQASYEDVSASDVKLSFAAGVASIPGATTGPVVTPTDPVTPNNPTTSDPDVVVDPSVPTSPTQTTGFKVNSPTDQGTWDYSTSRAVKISVVPGDAKAVSLTLKLIRFDTRVSVWEENNIKISDISKAVERSVDYEKLKVTNRYLLEVKTTAADGFTLVRQLYVTFNTTGQPTTSTPTTPDPVVTTPITKTITITKSEVMGIPVTTKDTIGRKYTITIPYTITETKNEQ